MSKKIIFFDVDGTLVDVRPAREYIPESTVKAVQETRKQGNLCFLCTGTVSYTHLDVYKRQALDKDGFDILTCFGYAN